jgi:hypothetical protein
MNPQQIGLLIVQAAAFLPVLAYTSFLLVKRREEKQKFRLYAIRDQLLYLAASGQLPQTSLVFTVFYRAVNGSIAEINKVTVGALIRASVRAKTELEMEKRERLLSALQGAPEEARAVVDQFASAMMDIMYQNSLVLVLFIASVRFASKLTNYIKKFVTSPKQYETYEYWSEIRGHVCPI